MKVETSASKTKEQIEMLKKQVRVKGEGSVARCWRRERGALLETDSLAAGDGTHELFAPLRCAIRLFVHPAFTFVHTYVCPTLFTPPPPLFTHVCAYEG